MAPIFHYLQYHQTLISFRSKMGSIQDSFQVHEKFLQETKGILHPNNYQVTTFGNFLDETRSVEWSAEAESVYQCFSFNSVGPL